MRCRQELHPEAPRSRFRVSDYLKPELHLPPPEEAGQLKPAVISPLSPGPRPGATNGIDRLPSGPVCGRRAAEGMGAVDVAAWSDQSEAGEAWGSPSFSSIPSRQATGADVGRAVLSTLDDGPKLGFISPQTSYRRG